MRTSQETRPEGTVITVIANNAAVQTIAIHLGIHGPMNRLKKILKGKKKVSHSSIMKLHEQRILVMLFWGWPEAKDNGWIAFMAPPTEAGIAALRSAVAVVGFEPDGVEVVREGGLN